MSEEMFGVYYISLGCFKNLYDTEDISGFMAEAGFMPVHDPGKADVVFINTCSFIKPAREESEEVIREMMRTVPDVPCIIGGCMVQQYGEKLLEKFPGIAGLVSFEHYCRIGEIARSVVQGDRVFRTGSDFSLPWWHSKRFRMTPGSYAYLKISEGCDSRCTFCTIPSIRGPFRSQPVADCVKRALTLTLYGVREIILISQNSSEYGRDIYGEPCLPKLLRELVRIKDLEWIRILYLYPGDSLNDELVSIMAEEDKICGYFDVPFQHVSPAVLKRMGRKGSPEEHHACIANIRNTCPDAALRTTLITGFPGETENDFDMLCRFVKEAEMDHVGCFVYSDEPLAASHSLDGKVKKKTAQQRKHRIMKLQKEIAAEKNEKKIGKVYRTAVDGISEAGLSVGHACFQSPEIDGMVVWEEESEPGTFTDIEITGYSGYDLEGRIAAE